MTRHKKDAKIVKVQVRVSENIKMKLDEVSTLLGVRKGVVVRGLIARFLADAYDDDGYLKEDWINRHEQARGDL